MVLEMDEVLQEFRIKDERVIEFGYPREMGNNNQPSNYTFNNISFSSTHDCQPLRQYLDGLNSSDRKLAEAQINKNCRHFGVDLVAPGDTSAQVEALLQLNLASLSSVAVQSMNDLLGQGKEGRINTPSTVGNNWVYRITKDDLSSSLMRHLLALNKRYGRC